MQARHFVGEPIQAEQLHVVGSKLITFEENELTVMKTVQPWAVCACGWAFQPTCKVLGD